MRVAGDSELKVYGIFGYPLGHTVSPEIQNRAFGYHKLKSIYFAFERPPARFRYLMRNLHSLLLSGFNITVPYKGIIIPYLDRLSSEARVIGAVNTVKKENGRWVGYNTDVFGFLTSLRKEGRINPRGKKFLVLGAGGSANAVVYGLARSGAREVWLASRHKLPRERIIKQFQRLFPGTNFDGFAFREKAKLRRCLKDVAVVINATSVGVLFESRPLIQKSLIPKAGKGRQMLFFDLVYHKPTVFLRSAKKMGYRTVDGKQMLLYQGAKAFEIWAGKRAPLHEMRKALHDALRSH